MAIPKSLLLFKEGYTLQNSIQMTAMPIGMIPGNLNYSFGSGKGSGIAMIFLLAGIIGFFVCMLALSSKNVRNLEMIVVVDMRYFNLEE